MHGRARCIHICAQSRQNALAHHVYASCTLADRRIFMKIALAIEYYLVSISLK